MLYKQSLDRFSGDAWIGLHTNFINGEPAVDAQWTDLTKVSFTNWAPGAPKYKSDWDGDCVCMYGLSKSCEK